MTITRRFAPLLSGCWQSFATLLVVGLMLVAGTARAGGIPSGVGSEGPLPSEFQGDDENGDMIMVGDELNPVPIFIDPEAPPWEKIFTINRDGQGWSPGEVVAVMEWIQIDPPPPSSGAPILPLTDWHEDIDPNFGDGGNFIWGPGSSIQIGPDIYPGTTAGTSIWFDNFPPVLPPIPIKITKELVWNGGVITPGQNGTNDYVIRVTEHPTVPEPSTLLLAGIGLATLAFVGRRRRK